ncbi:MAG: integrase core domain-containing protein [Acidimicrobiales bacterium]
MGHGGPHADRARRRRARTGPQAQGKPRRGDLPLLEPKQYLSGEFTSLCSRLGVRQSAGRVATCFDNSVAEAFWSSLKRELVHRYRSATRAEAIAAITFWIKRYNAVRLHSSIGYVPPIEWEIEYLRRQAQAA